MGRSDESRNERREAYRRDESRNRDESRYRNDDRRHRDESRYRNDDRRHRNDSRYRNDSRRYGSHHRYRSGRPYYHHGRITHFRRYGSGYRVWIGGAPYPFFVPLAYWDARRFRIGLSIGLGGYYNPGGYYDYYDGYRDGYRDRYYSERRLHSDADFVGEVESVDYRRDTFVVRNDATGDYVTVVLRDRGERFPRRGDYVAVRGDWTSRGYFRAYDVDILD